MIAELIRYAQSKGLDTEAGFRSKAVRWLLLFKQDGTFLGVAPYGVNKRSTTIPKAPHLQFSGDTPMRQFLIDTAEYYALLGGDPLDAKLRRKHAYAIDLLAKASEQLTELGPIAQNMARPETIEEVRSKLVSASAKSADNVTLALELPGGVRRIFAEETGWHGWWRSAWPRLVTKKEKTSKRSKSTPLKERSRCLGTGQLCDPEPTHPKVRGLGDIGGKAETALVAFNQDAFVSYGLDQSANAAFSVEAAGAYVGALNDLIETTAQRLGNVKVVHWFVNDQQRFELPPEQDPLRMVEGLDDVFGPPVEKTKAGKKKQQADAVATEQSAQAKARDFLSSVRDGKRGDLAEYRYHALTLSGSSARVMVRNYATGQFGQLCDAVKAWFDDLDIAHRDRSLGGLAPSPKFGAVLAAMVRELKDITPPTAATLWRCAVLREAIPESFASQTLRRTTLDFMLGDTPSHARMGLLRAYLVRKGSNVTTSFLNEDHPDPAYHCGRQRSCGRRRRGLSLNWDSSRTQDQQ
jgi:CRISPR-associated protein Csd1